MGSWTLPAPGTRKETVLKSQEARETCQGTPGLWKTQVSAVPFPHPHQARPPQSRKPSGEPTLHWVPRLGVTSAAFFCHQSSFLVHFLV